MKSIRLFFFKLSVVILVPLLLPELTAGAQAFAVRGKVTDATGLPVIGAVVMEKGSTKSNAGLTGPDGSWSLNVAGKNASLEFSCLGYKTLVITVEGKTVLDVVMQDENETLDDVVVVAYGTQKRANLTGAVAQISNSDLKTSPAGNVTATLAGKLPGLVTRQSSGQPGADGANMYIRGVGAGDGSMLVVVDGVIRSFPDVNPDEIESVTILKDATSAAAYGVRASAGVMLVTTRKGSVQKPTVTLNSSVSLSRNTAFPEFLSGPEYAKWYDYAQELDGVSADSRRFTPDEIDRITNGDPLGIYSDTDWFGLLFSNRKPTYTNSVSLSGGTETMKYFASVGAYNQNGIMERTSYDRYNFRINLDTRITESVSLSLGVAGKQGKQLSPGISAGLGNSYASILAQAMMMYPYLPVEYDGMPVGSGNLTGQGNQNPIAARDLSGTTSQNSTSVMTNASLTYKSKLIDGLSFKLNGSYDKTFAMKKLEYFAYKINVWNQSTRTWNVEWARHNSSGEDQVDQWYSGSTVYTLQPSVNYSGSFGGHNVSALFLYEYSRTDSESLSAGIKGFTIDDIMDITFGQEVMPSMVKGGHSINRRSGYVMRLNYNWQDKYLVESTVRLDGTPYLPDENRWGLFPGISFGWKISEEPFFKDNVPLVDMLKLRASLGRLGSDRSLGYSYSYLSTMSLSSNPVMMAGNTAVYSLSPSSPANTALRWQTNDTYDAGFDVRMWGGLLGVEFDAFYMLASNKLTSQSAVYPPSTGGWYSTYVNYGKHQNLGLELVLTHENHVGDFHYNVKGNVSWARNKILECTEDPNLPNYQKKTGHPMGEYYGFLYEGLFQSESEILSSPVYGTPEVGEIKHKDINRDGRITWEQDRTVTGRSSTPEMMFGLNFNAFWKDFDFNVFFQGAAICDIPLCGLYTDADHANTGYAHTFYNRPFSFDGNTPKYLVENSWTPTNTGAKYPRLSVANRNYGSQMSSLWIVDGSYLRLKSLQIGYSIPRKILSKTNISKARFYFAGGNLLTLCEFPYLDPEMPDVNQGYYPQQRTFEFGLNLSF